MQMWTEYKQTVNQQCYFGKSYGNLFGGKCPKPGLTSGFSAMKMPLRPSFSG
jgi:hypothetical protein